ncbi:hypothetical protein GQ600_11334 [Phytophthora cactorum]|nr:hypothetical protein GQ600_11334 [Phytophthora cactorum]
MRTNFTFDDDKQLVQLAPDIHRGWIPNRMEGRRSSYAPHGAHSSRTAPEAPVAFPNVGQRYQPLPCQFLHSSSASMWPPPAVTQQLRSLAANPPPRQSNRAGAAEPPSVARRAPAPPRPSPSGAASAPAARQNPAPPRSRPGGAAAAPVAHQSPTPPSQRPAGAVAVPAARQSPAAPLRPSPAPATGQGPAPPNTSPAGASSVLSSSNAEQAVASMFADVSRAAIAHPGDSPHLNVGEVLPLGSLHYYARLVTSMQVTFSLTLARV